MRLRIVIGGLVALAAACTKESVRPSVAESGSGAAEVEASAPAPSTSGSAATAATAEAAAPEAPAASAAATTPDAGIKDAGGLTTGATGDAGVKTVSLDDASDGKTIEIAKGGAIVLLLTATPTSGFDWAVLKAPPALGTPTLGFVEAHQPRGDQPGASGKRRIVWTIKDALPAGEHAVELGYARSFEKGVAPFKTFRFKVRAAK